jgi:hypothetical protein
MHHHFLLFKHKEEDKTCKKTKKKRRKGRELTFKFLLLPFHFKCFILVASSALSLLVPSFAFSLQAFPSFDNGVNKK